MRTLVWLIQRHCIWDSLSGTSSGAKGRTKNYLPIFKQMQEKSSSHLCLLFQSIHFGTLNPGLVLLLFRTYLELSRKWIWGSLGQGHQRHQAQNIPSKVCHTYLISNQKRLYPVEYLPSTPTAESGGFCGYPNEQHDASFLTAFSSDGGGKKSPNL